MTKTNVLPVIDEVIFKSDFVEQAKLMEGSDGTVTKWRHFLTGEVVAVKTAKQGSSDEVQKEIDTYKLLEAYPHEAGHLHIMQVLGYMPVGPKLVMEFAVFGDAMSYRQNLVKEYDHMLEETLWKFTRDSALALDWLHNQFDVPFVHADLKPYNIIACAPESYDGQTLPTLPIFKICDFSRMREAGSEAIWFGTPEYGPPMEERWGSLAPTHDMWSLGASTQAFALDILPVMSRSDFARYAKEALPEHNIQEEELRARKFPGSWRFEVPPICRPLDLPIEVEKEILRIEEPFKPYSNAFNRWYLRLMDENPKTRITAETMVRQFVPVADCTIRELEQKRRRETAYLEHKERVRMDAVIPQVEAQLSGGNEFAPVFE